MTDEDIVADINERAHYQKWPTDLTPAAQALRDEYPGIWYWEDDRWKGPLGTALQAEARATAEAEMREMARSIVRLGHDTGGVVCYCGVHEDARRILAATPAEPPTLPEPDLDIIDTTQQGEP